MALQGNGSTGWVAAGIGMQAAAQFGYTLFCWARFKVDPGASVCSVLSWSGPTAFVKTALWGVTGGWNFIDVDNPLTTVQGGIAYTFSGLWQPVLLTKSSQSLRTLAIGQVDPITDFSSSPLADQTLTDIYVGTDQDGNFMLTSSAVAEAAVWLGPMSDSARSALFAGACPLSIHRARLAAYWPLAGDLQNYAPQKSALIGPAPVWTDHPPVQNYRSVLNAPYTSSIARRLARRSQ